MRKLFYVLAINLATIITGSTLADVEPGEFGVTYNCGFPAEDITLDGKFNEICWIDAHWDKVDHTNSWKDKGVPDDDEDASFEFACVADRDFLYIGVKITDDEKIADEMKRGQNEIYNDDCMEIYIDGAHEGTKGAYDNNDSQIMIARANVGDKACPDDPILSGAWWHANALKGIDTGTKVFAIDTADGWNLEVAIPLVDAFGVVIEHGNVIGFNIHYCDDDDGSDRDHIVAWGKAEVQTGEAAYTDPSTFGDLKFVETKFAVSPSGKAAYTWGRVKAGCFGNY